MRGGGWNGVGQARRRAAKRRMACAAAWRGGEGGVHGPAPPEDVCARRNAQRAGHPARRVRRPPRGSWMQAGSGLCRHARKRRGRSGRASADRGRGGEKAVQARRRLCIAYRIGSRPCLPLAAYQQRRDVRSARWPACCACLARRRASCATPCAQKIKKMNVGRHFDDFLPLPPDDFPLLGLYAGFCGLYESALLG